MISGFPLALPGMSVGLLGGSFDPAHSGHLAITHTALQRFRLDRVWWLVSPGNPMKPHPPAALNRRVQAARQMITDPRVVATDLEARLGTRMTADTIGALQRRYRGVRFVWLMGSDNLVQFHLWDRWRDIAARVPIGVMARPGSRLAARNAVAARVMRDARLPEVSAAALARTAPPAWAMVNMPMSPLSSSAIRAGLRRDEDAS